jgi:hypothetical protein
MRFLPLVLGVRTGDVSPDRFRRFSKNGPKNLPFDDYRFFESRTLRTLDVDGVVSGCKAG